MPDGRWLIEWIRSDENSWRCNGPIPADFGFVVVGSEKVKTPVVIRCDRDNPDPENKPYICSHMLGPNGEAFWERWYLPPGVHPKDVQPTVDYQNKCYEKWHANKEYKNEDP